MSINQTIISTISPICPIDFHEYTGDSTTYITIFSSGQSSGLIADNEELITSHTVHMSFYSNGNINSLVTQTKALLKPYNFRRISETESKEKDINGVIIDSASDEAPFFALGFRAKKSNGEYRMV